MKRTYHDDFSRGSGIFNDDIPAPGKWKEICRNVLNKLKFTS